MKYKAAYSINVKHGRVESSSNFTLIFLQPCIRKKLQIAGSMDEFCVADEIVLRGGCDMGQEMMRAAVLTDPKQIEIKNVPCCSIR